MNTTKFEKQCEEVSAKLGYGEVMFFEEDRRCKPFEDDGNLHVTKGRRRAVFDVGAGQSLRGKDQNERARKVLFELGIPANEDCFVIEECEKDDYCPYCGRDY